MKLFSSSALALVVLATVSSPQASAFAPASIVPSKIASCSSSSSSSSLQVSNSNHNHNHNNHQVPVKSTNGWMTNVAVAGGILAASVASTTLAPPPAMADSGVELSTGAILIQTSTKQGGSLGLKTQLDAKSLLSTLFQNRKALAGSVERIEQVVAQELKSPAVVAVGKELLDLEGDVLPELEVKAPRDLSQLLQDVSKGKLNLIVNGEIINLSIDETFSQSEDEIVVRAKGIKGVAIPGKFQTMSKSSSDVITTQLSTGLYGQINSVQAFLNQPLSLPDGVTLNGYVPKMSDAIVGGSITLVGGSYAAAYSYYLAEQAAEQTRAEEKRLQMAEKKKKAAAATKKKAEAATESKDKE